MQAPRFIAVLLSLGLMASSCGSDSENAGDTTVPTEASVGTEPEGGGAEPVDEPAEEGEDAAVELEESLVILCTLQEEGARRRPLRSRTRPVSTLSTSGSPPARRSLDSRPRATVDRSTSGSVGRASDRQQLFSEVSSSPKLSNILAGTADQITQNLIDLKAAGMTMPLIWPPFTDVPVAKTLEDLQQLVEEIMPKVNAA